MENPITVFGIIPTHQPKQAIRIQRFLMASASYALGIALILYFYWQNIFRMALGPLLNFLAFICLTNCLFYVVLRTGLNKKFKDPSLTLPQTAVAVSWLTVVTYFTDEARGLVLSLYLVVFIFGIFRLKMRQFIILAIYAVVSYAAVLSMLLRHHPDSIDLRIEWLQWIVLTTILAWFSLLGGHISRLRNTIDIASKKLEESALRYRELYENMMDIVLLVDREGKIQMANPLFYKETGIDHEQDLSISSEQFVHPGDWHRIRHYIAERFSKKEDVKDLQFRVIKKDQEIADVECNAKCIQKGRKILGYQMVVRDITERKKLEKDLLESYRSLQNARAVTILGLAKLAEYRDQNTGAHLERIREYARIIATALSRNEKYSDYITSEYIEDLYISSILHDIGKVGIPDAILLKPERLTQKEFEIVKCHTTLGGDALKAAEAQIEGQSFLTIGKEISYHHHEKWDGSGYPKGLKGEEIPLSARLVALADVYDALTSDRIYKRAYTHHKAMEILVAERGRHFDPDIIDAFLLHEEDFKAIRSTMRHRGECPSEPDAVIRLDERRINPHYS